MKLSEKIGSNEFGVKDPELWLLEICNRGSQNVLSYIIKSMTIHNLVVLVMKIISLYIRKSSMLNFLERGREVNLINFE